METWKFPECSFATREPLLGCCDLAAKIRSGRGCIVPVLGLCLSFRMVVAHVDMLATFVTAAVIVFAVPTPPPCPPSPT